MASTSLPKEKPSIRVDENDLSEIKDWKIDDEVTITVKAKVSNLGRDRWTDDKRLWATLEIQSVKNSSSGSDAISKGMDSVKPTKVARS